MIRALVRTTLLTVLVLLGLHASASGQTATATATRTPTPGQQAFYSRDGGIQAQTNLAVGQFARAIDLNRIGLKAPADDVVPLGNGLTWVDTTIPDCSGASNALIYTASSNTFGCNTVSGGGGGGTVTSVAAGAGLSASPSPITGSGTLTCQTASASVTGCVNSSDWSTFNGKIGGSGTDKMIARFNGTSAIQNSGWSIDNSDQMSATVTTTAAATGITYTLTGNASSGTPAYVGTNINATTTSGAAAPSTVDGQVGVATCATTNGCSLVYGSIAKGINSNTGTVLGLTGVYADIQNTNAGGSVLNGYGVYIDNPVKTGTVTNLYGLYQAGPEDNSLGGALAFRGTSGGVSIINVAATTPNITYTLPTSVPTAGQVLSSAVGGQLSWTSAATGSVGGSGTATHVPTWATSSTLQNSGWTIDATDELYLTTSPTVDTTSVFASLTGNGAGAAHVYTAGEFVVTASSGAGASSIDNALFAGVTCAATAGCNALSGVIGTATNTAASGTVTTAIGVSGTAAKISTGVISNAYGGSFGLVNSASGAITNGYGVYIAAPAVSGGGTITNTYGFYQTGTEANILHGNVAIGSTTFPTNQLEVTGTTSGTMTTTAASGLVPAMTYLGQLGNTSGSTARVTGLTGQGWFTGTATATGSGRVIGVTGDGENVSGSSVTVPLVIGGLFTASNESATSTATSVYALSAQAMRHAAGPVTNLVGIYSQLTNNASGAVTSGYGLYIDTPVLGGGGTITNTYGLYQNGTEDNSLGGPLDFRGTTGGVTKIAAVGTVPNVTYKLPTALPAADGQALISTIAGQMSWASRFTGPGSSTDTGIVRFNGTTGALVQDSAVTIDAANMITMPATSAATSGTPAGLTAILTGNPPSGNAVFIAAKAIAGSGATNAVNTLIGTEGVGYCTTTGGCGKIVGLYGYAARESGAGTVTTAQGGYFQVANLGSGTVTNGYGVFVDTPVNAGTATLFGFYQAGTEDNSFGGAIDFRGGSGGVSKINATSGTTPNITYTLPTVAPTAGQILSSAVGGQLSWIVAGGTGTVTQIIAGTGLSGGTITGSGTIATDSTQAGFLASGALTCGAATAGKIKTHTTPLQYCDNAATPVLQYAAYGTSSGQATGLARTMTTTAPLRIAGGGSTDLTLDRTWSITQADSTHDGYITQGDWNTFNGKVGQNTTDTLTNKTLTTPTINGGALSGTFTGAPTLSGAVVFTGTVGSGGGPAFNDLSISGNVACGGAIFGGAPYFTGDPQFTTGLQITGGALQFFGTSSGVSQLTVAATTPNITYKLPTSVPTAGQVLISAVGGQLSWANTGIGAIIGPGSSTDTAIVRFNGTSGVLAQNSAVLINAANMLTMPATSAATSGTAIGLNATLTGDPASGNAVFLANKSTAISGVTNAVNTLIGTEGFGYCTTTGGCGKIVGIYGYAARESGAGTVTAAQGGYFQVANLASGTMTTGYGVYVDTPVNSGTATLFGFYQNGTEDNSFGGAIDFRGGSGGVSKINATSGTTPNITYTLPTSVPTAGQVLSSAVGGQLSWVSAGGTGTVTNIAAGTGISTGGSAITTTGTVSLDYANTLAGHPALGAGQCTFDSTDSGLVCEGATADAVEIALVFPDPVTSNKTVTLPNATTTLVGKDTTDTFTNKIFDTSATGNHFQIGGVNITATTPVSAGTIVGSLRSLATGTGLTGGGDLSADRTYSLDYSQSLAGNPALATKQCVFDSTDGGILCEGATADAIEIALVFPDPVTTDKTITLPNATTTLVGQDTTDTLINKTLTTPTINGGALGGTFTGAPTLTGAIAFTGTAAGSGSPAFNDLSISGNVACAGAIFGGQPYFTGNPQFTNGLQIAGGAVQFFGTSSGVSQLGRPVGVAPTITYTLPTTAPTTGQVLSSSNTGTLSWTTTVAGPGSSTDTGIVRFNGSTGALVQDSAVTIDSNQMLSGTATTIATSGTAIGLSYSIAPLSAAGSGTRIAAQFDTQTADTGAQTGDLYGVRGLAEQIASKNEGSVYGVQGLANKSATAGTTTSLEGVYGLTQTTASGVAAASNMYGGHFKVNNNSTATSSGRGAAVFIDTPVNAGTFTGGLYGLYQSGAEANLLTGPLTLSGLHTVNNQMVQSFTQGGANPGTTAGASFTETNTASGTYSQSAVSVTETDTGTGVGQVTTGLTVLSNGGGSATIPVITGISGTADSSTSVGGLVVTGINGYGKKSGPGAVTQVIGGSYGVINSNATGAITTGIGLAIATGSNAGGGGITTLVGLSIADQLAGGTNWSMKVGSAQSFHVGNLRLGDTTAPTTLLDLVGKTTFTNAGLVTRYNNIASAGLGVPAIYSEGISGTQTGSVTIATYTPPATAGRYRISAVLSTTASTNTGTINLTLDYVDAVGTTHTADVLPAVSATGVWPTSYPVTIAASKQYHVPAWEFAINNAATNIVLKTVVTGTVSYTVAWDIEQLG